MNKLIIFTAAICIAVTLPACKKKATKTDDPEPASYDNYMMLKPGNYWVYRKYTRDSATAEGTTTDIYDSCFVDKDTVLKGNTYHRYMEPRPGSIGAHIEYDIYYLRDSLNYVVDAAGYVYFSSLSTDSVLSYFPRSFGGPDTGYEMHVMVNRDAVVDVDAGSFSTLTFRKIYMYPVTSTVSQRSRDYTYAKNIGKVFSSEFIAAWSPALSERRLVRYHVQ